MNCRWVGFFQVLLRSWYSSQGFSCLLTWLCNLKSVFLKYMKTEWSQCHHLGNYGSCAGTKSWCCGRIFQRPWYVRVGICIPKIKPNLVDVAVAELMSYFFFPVKCYFAFCVLLKVLQLLNMEWFFSSCSFGCDTWKVVTQSKAPVALLSPRNLLRLLGLH